MARRVSPQPGAALDVGEQKRRSAGRTNHHLPNSCTGRATEPVEGRTPSCTQLRVNLRPTHDKPEAEPGRSVKLGTCPGELGTCPGELGTCPGELGPGQPGQPGQPVSRVGEVSRVRRVTVRLADPFGDEEGAQTRWIGEHLRLARDA